MQFFRDVSLRAKLSGSFAAVIVMFSVAVFVGWSSIGSVAGTVRAGYAAGIAAEAASAAAYNMHVSEVQNVADGGKVLAMHQQDEAAFADALAGVRSAARSAAERAGVQNVDTAYADWKPLDDRVIAEARRGDTRSAAVLVDGAANSASDALSQRLDALSKLFRSAADSRSASSQLRARTLMLVIALVALLSTAAIAFLIVRSIKRTVDVILNRLTSLCENGMTWLADGLQAFARGDLTLGFTPFTPPIEHPSNDELGQIAAKVNVVREKMRTAVFAYNETAERLRETIGQVAQTAGSVSSSSQEMAVTSQEAGRATGEIAHAVGDVARGAERQVRMVEAARRAAEDVARAVGEAAQSAGQAAEVAHGTRQTAKDGVDAAAQANQAMTSVRDSSQAVSEAIRELAAKSDQIGHIVETITAIAEQTNLLALNAAIEAARAGEQGRGFAVVAEEVRKLAEDSQSAAQEISVLIGAIQSDTTKAVAVVEGGAQRTQDGAAVVERTREAFAQIESSVDDMTGRIEQIAAASQQIDASAQSMQNSIAEVAAVAEQSSASTEEVSASTEQTTASTEEIAASAQQLSGNAETLNSLVSRFKLSAG